MVAYVIVFGKDPSDRLAVYAFETRIEAVRACGSNLPFEYPGVPPGSHAGGHSWVVENSEDVIYSDRALLAIFNGLTESGVTRFESRANGIERLLSVLPQVAKPINFNPEESVMAKGKNNETTVTTQKKSGRPAVNETHETKANFRRPRAGTMRANVLMAMLTPATVKHIAKKASIPEDRVVPHIYATWRDCKIGYETAGEGEHQTYVALLPPGETGETILQPDETETKAAKAEAAKAAKAAEKEAAKAAKEAEKEAAKAAKAAEKEAAKAAAEAAKAPAGQPTADEALREHAAE